MAELKTKQTDASVAAFLDSMRMAEKGLTPSLLPRS